MITDEMVECGAKALYEQLPLSKAMPCWEDLNDSFRAEWRGRAKAILEAALGANEKFRDFGGRYAAMREALEIIAFYDVRGHDGYVDEWIEAAAFRHMQEVARKALAALEGGDQG